MNSINCEHKECCLQNYTKNTLQYSHTYIPYRRIDLHHNYLWPNSFHVRKKSIDLKHSELIWWNFHNGAIQQCSKSPMWLKIPCNLNGTLSNRTSGAGIKCKIIKIEPIANYKASVTHNQIQSTDNITFIIFIHF